MAIVTTTHFKQRYYRNARGKIIHKDTCRHASARTAVPWNFADGFSEFYMLRPWLLRGVASMSTAPKKCVYCDGTDRNCGFCEMGVPLDTQEDWDNSWGRVLTNGSGAPPPGWDPDEAAERIRVEAHARPEHAAWMAAKDDKGQRTHFCPRCDGGL